MLVGTVKIQKWFVCARHAKCHHCVVERRPPSSERENMLNDKLVRRYYYC